MPPTEPSLRARPSLRSLTWLYLALSVIGVLIWWAGATFNTGVSPLLIALAGLIPLALGLAYSWLVRLSSEYRLFADSIEVETGLVARTVDNLQLFRVRDLRLQQSMLDRLLGVGDISVTSTDQTTPRLTIRGVTGPRNIYDALREGVARSQATRRTMIVEEEPPSS